MFTDIFCGTACLVMLLVYLYCGFDLKRFLERTPCARDEASLERFKILVRRNMYCALFQLAMLPVLIIAVFVFIMHHGLTGFCIVMGISGLLLPLNRLFTSLERRVKGGGCPGAAARQASAGAGVLGQEIPA